MPGKKLKLTYWPIAGFAEASRVCLVLGGVEFEDNRVSGDQLKEIREKGGGFADFGRNVPILEVGGKPATDDKPEIPGKFLSQSFAVETYCAKLAGLYPEDTWTASLVDEVSMLLFDDFRGKIAPTIFISDAKEKMAKRKEVAGKLPEILDRLEGYLAASKSGYVVGDSMTVADVRTYVMMNWIASGILDGIPADLITKREKIVTFMEMMSASPKLKAWNAEKNPKFLETIPWCKIEGDPPKNAVRYFGDNNERVVPQRNKKPKKEEPEKPAAPAAAAADAKLLKENAELKQLLAAVQTLQSFTLKTAPAAPAEKKGKKGAKEEATEEEKPKKAKRPRNRGKGKKEESAD
jgi:glutathione S-transferase